ncbi:molybdopterin-guanine dinucleotide biosynthesis protein [Plantibacter sp. VKM Ac-2880]|uniref:DUF6457 domain-containing protein n=1 Tax=Plantibacter sp. VKM Ac-2880 TaxID=2783827 RepID=UPI00188E12A1|nr:DUF6457 domain-containing protein [Plantibacter sp. VKM Ac-2880]MBF4567617.1 molybdopterin-guanine dinucleotide biosynthesis protein [Plantibacter sp. VKM Ac-2880]
MTDDLHAVLAEWSDRVSAALELGDVPVDIGAVLGLAGTAAHAVRRPAAPLTTYLVGIAVGKALAAGADPAAVAQAATVVVERLAAEASDEPDSDTPHTSGTA